MILRTPPTSVPPDLRRLAAEEPAGQRLRSPRLRREIGAVSSGDEGMVQLQVLPDRFDAVLFLEQTTPTRPVT